jgi:hypothetical protein
MAKDRHKIFEEMMQGILSGALLDQTLEDCMSFQPEVIKSISVRYRIIALGFIKHMSLDELNEKLTEQGCPKLYSRNFWEATLIYAFLNSLSWQEWKHVLEECRNIYSSEFGGKYFQDKKITYGELERYVTENSVQEGQYMGTAMLTRKIEKGLEDTSGIEGLKNFLNANIRSFSAVREKSRYYFCKYLYYYLNRRIENYFKACKKGTDTEQALCDLLALKVVTALRRKKTLPENEKRKLIHESAISCGELFDEFNYFYFEYVSIDWVEILMEYYGEASFVPPAQKKRLAEVFRKGRPDWKKLDDDSVIQAKIDELNDKEEKLQEIYAKDSKTKGYGKNRSGELAVYKYIQGSLDLDRTTLICFLLFFASDADMPEEHRLTSERLNHILLQCGFSSLQSNSDFDGFVDEFLNSPYPKDLLMDEVVSYAKQQENSFLYHIYGNSVSYEDEILKIMI